MAIVFKTPKSALNTTSKTIQNLGNGECPPCPECPEVNLETADVNYTENGEYTLTPEGDGFSKVDITVNVDTETPYNEGYAAGEEAGYEAGETAGIATGKAEGIAEQKAKLTSVTLTENGTSTREDGWNSVTVNVVPDLQAKTVNPSTSQQVVSPDQGKDGLSSVTVTAVTAAIDQNIQPANILSGITILGVEGTDEGYDAGEAAGHQSGYDEGHTAGYDEGYAAGQAECPTPTATYVNETITDNGTYVYDPSDYQGDSFDYFSGVEITVNVSGGTPVTPIPFTITSLENNSTITFADPMQLGIESSIDDGTTWVSNNNAITTTWQLNEGDKLMLRNIRRRYGLISTNTIPPDAAHIKSDKTFNVSGHLMYLVDYTDITSAKMDNYCFSAFFQGGVVDASGLIFPDYTTSACYQYMFSYQQELVAPPTLPAWNIAECAYRGMFYNCSGLTTTPALPSTVVSSNSYDHMFAGCTSITSAPALPANVLSNACYSYMFDGCTSLTTAPALPSTELANSCYTYMFRGCTSLVVAPDLPATSISSKGYQYMFANCTSLNYVKCLATNIGANNVNGWLSNVAATGTFVKYANTTWPTGTIPSGWTVEDYVDPNAS